MRPAVPPSGNSVYVAGRDSRVDTVLGRTAAASRCTEELRGQAQCIGMCDATVAHNTRSSEIYEAILAIPLTEAQRNLAAHLDTVNKWYLILHVTYILLFVILGTVLFVALERDLSLIDAFFIAMSTVCNCGLQTVDTSQFRPATNVFRHLLMVPGGVVFTSAHQPLLRLWMLSRIQPALLPCIADTLEERTLRAVRLLSTRRLLYTSLICCLTPLLYFVAINVSVMFLLHLCNTSHLSMSEVILTSLASFHGCISSPMEQYAGDAAVVGLVTVACALGFTVFPVVLRAFILVEWGVYRCARALWSRGHSLTRQRCGEADVSSRSQGGEEAEPLLVNGLRERSGEREVMKPTDEVDQGFRDVLSSEHPGMLHVFLFRPSDSTYLGVAWCALTFMQAIPFLVQQWDTLLKPYSIPYGVYLSICQAGAVRFAAASFLHLQQYTHAHIAITILAMFLPALPISTDRTYRKWAEMFRTSVVRLLTSRLFWLYTAIVAIMFLEETSLAAAAQGTRFDVMTRTFFEVLSAYAGCGLSLPLNGSAVSFVGSLGVASKLIISLVLFGGRHRFVDLGIDLGFAALHVEDEGESLSPEPRVSLHHLRSIR